MLRASTIKTAMSIVECEVPSSSTLDGRVVESAYFRDAYRAPVRHADASLVDIFFSVFGHQPWWMKMVLIARNQLAGLGGLEVPTVSDILNPVIKSSYAVGDKIGPWPIFALSDTELVAGRNNRHLDFRLSVLKEAGEHVDSVVIATICTVHNLAGKIYLFFIVPFHRWGVKRLMAKAISEGRL